MTIVGNDCVVNRLTDPKRCVYDMVLGPADKRFLARVWLGRREYIYIEEFFLTRAAASVWVRLQTRRLAPHQKRMEANCTLLGCLLENTTGLALRICMTQAQGSYSGVRAWRVRVVDFMGRKNKLVPLRTSVVILGHHSSPPQASKGRTRNCSHGIAP